ncbi:uncharacterized protein BX663DRAFT_509230 [Cokeromyces recurvatus]|uniref:uncharacterized protein n=1 Tax=Cokeromyces recurvatus TaxID=90255 RepID=UPI00221ED8B7|nr:uncharacterized protein BX663DRAFT_509230 [Cokeromyces recurvatus]KAI7903013.1 hypothetical protein BX663DRAFT_509230 [Cokeromyces recurvatus]
MPSSKEDIKIKLINHVPTAEEKLVIRSVMFNFITFSTVGAASLGMSARLWANSRTTIHKQPRSAIPTILGTFIGLVLGGILGMDRGMHKLRKSLPENSELLAIIHENDQLKKTR